MEFCCTDYTVRRKSIISNSFLRVPFRAQDKPPVMCRSLKTHHLLLDLCCDLPEKVVEGFVFGLQLGTLLSVQKCLIEPTELLESLSSPEPGFHVARVDVEN